MSPISVGDPVIAASLVDSHDSGRSIAVYSPELPEKNFLRACQGVASESRIPILPQAEQGQVMLPGAVCGKFELPLEGYRNHL